MKRARLTQALRADSQLKSEVVAALAELKRRGSEATRAGMARYGLPSERALGVPMGAIQNLGKELGRDHELADGLWATGCYEARLLVAYVADPARLTAAQMDRWVRDFDNWGVCDTLCFALFDRTPKAWAGVQRWGRQSGEFVKRAGLAVLAGLALHDRKADDGLFLEHLPLVEAGAHDERNFVKKGALWALRSIGARNSALHEAAMKVAWRLAAEEKPAPRWVGKTALRELRSPATLRRIAARAAREKPAS